MSNATPENDNYSAGSNSLSKTNQNENQHDFEENNENIDESNSTDHLIDEINQKWQSTGNTGSNSHEKDTHTPTQKTSPPNPKSYNDFIERQDKSNDQKLKYTISPISQRSEPTTPNSRYENEPNTAEYEWVKPTKSDPDYQSPGNMSPHTKSLYESSIKANRQQYRAQETATPTKNDLSRASKSSLKMANNRYKKLVENMINTSQPLSYPKYVQLLRKFNIPIVSESDEISMSQRPLFCKISDLTKIDDDSYDSVKLKELLCKAASGEPVSGLAAQIRPSVMAAISNMRPSLVCPHRSPNKRTPKSDTTNGTPKKSGQTSPNGMTITINSKQPSPQLNRQQQNNQKSNKNSQQQKDEESTDYDDDEPEVAVTEPVKSPSSVKPVKKSPKGANYLPGFYDNIDFYMNKSPSKA